jgi:DNA modification methylase
MTPSWQLIESDCLDAMRAMDADSVDAVVTDPPYGLGFMGKDWDSPGGLGDMPMRRNHATNTVNTGASRQGGRQRATEDFQRRQARDARSYQAWCEEWARELLRVLRPMGCAVVFGGTRTYHRLTCGLEDAGFEIRDQLDWLYGSGFPKHPSALKPAHEPILLARKAGARSEPLNIDACRLATADSLGGGAEQGTRRDQKGNEGWERPWMDDDNARAAHAARVRENVRNAEQIGRWPANVLVDDDAAAIIDEQSGESVSRVGKPRSGPNGDGWGMTATGAESDDAGGASRFFYCAKPDTAERNVGLDGRNPHPTVKPVELMRWLIRLVTPEGGTVLDPFMGSGTTGIAALREQRSFVGVDQEAEYVTVARARIVGDAPLLNGVLEKMTPPSEQVA